ncbi:rhamnogalacturonan acetylesterase [Carboxylicivirga sp. N1Y90]|uniref:rhamnogalacturonan acetylesterase n=1 Tax=Carboxylicivirga fragile TaxID=3417571 RepID=UPI003D32E076|nr:rhamnogalacturonan acetylesterase [Marinilabiliaceae bacterium N1Y90]
MKRLINFFFTVLILASCQQPSTYTIYLAGDSTMAEKREDKHPETGWGMELQSFFNDNVTIANHAKNGRSTRTFIEEGRWDSIMGLLHAGDYVFIQFGHNDQSKHKVDRYTSPEDFYQNLCRFVEDVNAKNATPVLLTPVMRRRFNEDGVFYDVHGEYPDLVRKAVADKKVTLLDMHKLSGDLLIQLGEEQSKSLFMIADSAVWENYPDGIDDNTHFNVKGATMIAELAVKAIKLSEIEIKEDLK